MLGIVRGEPSDEELAALTVALAALADIAVPEPPGRPSAWLDRAYQLRRAPAKSGSGRLERQRLDHELIARRRVTSKDATKLR